MNTQPISRVTTTGTRGQAFPRRVRVTEARQESRNTAYANAGRLDFMINLKLVATSEFMVPELHQRM